MNKVQNVGTDDYGVNFSIGKTHKVPTLPRDIHRDTNIPYASSPETLDEVINNGTGLNPERASLGEKREDTQSPESSYDTPFSISTDPSLQ